MLLDAAVLAALSALAFTFAWDKLPRKVRRYLAKHHMLSDILEFVMVYFAFGGTATSMLAGGLVVFFTNALMHIHNNPDDFLYLWDLKRAMEEAKVEIKQELHDFGLRYREKRDQGEPPLAAATDSVG